MVTEAFAVVRSGEKIAYITVHEHGMDGVNLSYGDKFTTFRYLEDLSFESLIKDYNLKYRSLKLIVNTNADLPINSCINKDKIDKEVTMIISDDKIILKNEDFEEVAFSNWFREIYYYFIDESTADELSEWENATLWGM